jgi:mannose-6-phosphate isomerase-like protein (cupin superfamily)
VFFAVAGEIELRLGDETVRLPAGSCAAAPPLLLHGFRNPGATEARYLNLHAPGGWASGRRELEPEEFDTFFGLDGGSREVRGVVTGPGDGDRLRKEHRLALVKLHHPDLDVLEYFVDAEYDGAGPHVHLRHADCFHVFEGALELKADGKPIRAEPGMSVVIPHERRLGAVPERARAFLRLCRLPAQSRRRRGGRRHGLRLASR